PVGGRAVVEGDAQVAHGHVVGVVEGGRVGGGVHRGRGRAGGGHVDLDDLLCQVRAVPEGDRDVAAVGRPRRGGHVDRQVERRVADVDCHRRGHHDVGRLLRVDRGQVEEQQAAVVLTDVGEGEPV